jgi:hypothetical protein
MSETLKLFSEGYNLSIQDELGTFENSRDKLQIMWKLFVPN